VHNINWPHHDVYLGHESARKLGFGVIYEELDWVDLKGRIGTKGLTYGAAKLTVTSPLELQDKPFQGAAGISECGALHDELSYTVESNGTQREITTFIVTLECVPLSRFLAVYHDVGVTENMYYQIEMQPQGNN